MPRFGAPTDWQKASVSPAPPNRLRARGSFHLYSMQMRVAGLWAQIAAKDSSAPAY
jgi:hypothetical protein